ncbi:hypothetical protein RKE38_16310 [Phycicoccus sp. M110.8]|uniref:hypothetical protein n=1 Tax=Phycicoccus sp. M110.8 TaxID=3075433 RepID=UPI0028FCFF31|nr:hypothetical protein [Phycicoccus sp. M110.8]MDU0315264.1 hypothetical protein [Phycicoccus sp. M110.8]
MTRPERVQDLRHRLGDHSLPTALERIVDNGDGTVTVVEMTDDGVTQHRTLWPTLNEEVEG